MTEHTYKLLRRLPDAGLRAKWDDLFQNASFGTHYVTPDFFADPFAGNGERFAVLATDGDQINAVLTGSKNGRTIASGLAVRPQTVFRNGTNISAAAGALIEGVAEFAGNEVDLINFYSWEPVPGLDLSGYEHELCSDSVIMLDLAKGPEALFDAFSKNRRSDLRKVIKQANLEIKTLETDTELAELYDVYKVWSARKGNIPNPFELFQKILSPKHRISLIALHDGKIVAGSYFRFCEGGIVEYAANNSLPEYNHLHPNELLGWRAIEWACTAGFTHLSLGASHPFLTRFGGEKVSTHRYQMDRTFLKRHVNRERVSRLAVKTYLSLPESVRRRIKSAAARV